MCNYSLIVNTDNDYSKGIELRLLDRYQLKVCDKTIINFAVKIWSKMVDKVYFMLNRKGMEDMSELKIELLTTLAEGCRKHPAYRARRAATQRCPECVEVWNARLHLNEILRKQLQEQPI
tara:strand:- start:379 stop:738 length:360 start_codon:yes stop_codon:yes gene_type:complete